MAKKKKEEYGVDSLQHHADTAGIRMRPSMYIGSLGAAGTKHLFLEAIDNSFDEFRNGHGNDLYVIIDDKTGTITSRDTGRGMPPEGIEMLMTKTHSGGKFGKDAYSFSRGLNGVGLKCICALSTEVIVTSYRDGVAYTQTFSKGKVTSKLKITKAPKEKNGTKTVFKPDVEVLEDISMDINSYFELIEKTSYLNKGVKIHFTGIPKKGKTVEKLVCSKNGLSDFVAKLEKKPLVKDNISFESKHKKYEIEIEFNYSAKEEETLFSFVNGSETKYHGTHVQGFRMSLTKFFSTFIKDNKMITKKDGKLEITGDDVREGLVCVISAKHSDPVFDSQTKDKLTNNDILGFANTATANALSDWALKNKESARLISKRIIASARGRIASTRAKKAAAKKESGIFGLASVDKFINCNSNDPAVKELWICEGASAGGSASSGRDPEIQAIFKMKGKPKKVWESLLGAVRSNKELDDMIKCFGTGAGKDFDLSKSAFHNHIIAADADDDGCHIRVLLLGFYHRHFPEIIKAGHLYISVAPLYKIKDNGKEIYIRDNDEYNKFINNKISKLFTIKFSKKKGVTEIISGKELLKIVQILKGYEVGIKNINDYLSSCSYITEAVASILCSKKLSESQATIEKALLKRLKGFTIKNHKLEGIHNHQFYSLDLNKNTYKAVDPIVKTMKLTGLTKQFIFESDKDGKQKGYLEAFISTAIKRATPSYRQRYKGLGEMNPDQLWDTTMNPKKRTLIQVQFDESLVERYEEELKIYLGSDPKLKRQFIASNELSLDDLTIK